MNSVSGFLVFFLSFLYHHSFATTLVFSQKTLWSRSGQMFCMFTCCLLTHPEGGSTNSDIGKNSDWSSQWSSMRRTHEAKLGRVVCKIILQKYTWLWIDPSDVLVLTVYPGTDQIFTDYPTGSQQMACIFCRF